MKALSCVVVSSLLAGCASIWPAPAPLRDADAKLVAQDYSGALAAYSQFTKAAPDHVHAPRARAMQMTLERLLSYESEIGRAQRTGELARREATERQAETERLRAEVAKLRADLERLRSIDLETARPDTKK